MRPKPSFNAQGIAMPITHSKRTPRGHYYGNGTCHRCINIGNERRLGAHVDARRLYAV